MADLSLSPKFRACVPGTSTPLVGGKLYTYLAGTTTLQATASNEAGTANTNPIILDSNGECDLWLGDLSYKFILRTAADGLIWTVDNVSSITYLINQAINISAYKTVADYTALLALDPAGSNVGDVVTVTSSTKNGDFVARSGSVSDNGGTIKSNAAWSAAVKYFDRMLENYDVYVGWFLDADGQSDESAKLQQAIDCAYIVGTTGTLQRRANLYFPPGVIRCDETIIFYPFINYLGVRATTADSGADFTVLGDSRGTIIRQSPNLYTNDIASAGVHIFVPTGDITIRNITFVGTTGINGNPSIGIQWGGRTASGGRTHEVSAQNCSGVEVSGCRFYTYVNAWECVQLNDCYVDGVGFETNTRGILFSGLLSGASNNSVEFNSTTIFGSAESIGFADGAAHSHIIRFNGGEWLGTGANQKLVNYLVTASNAPDVDFLATGVKFRHLSASGTVNINLSGDYDSSTQNWTFNGCQLETGAITAIRGSGTKPATNLRLYNCDLKDTTITLNVTDNTKFNGGTWENTSVSITSGTQTEIKTVTFRDLSGTGITVTNTDCVDLDIQNNHFDNVTTQITIFDASGQLRHTIENNAGHYNVKLDLSAGAYTILPGNVGRMHTNANAVGTTTATLPIAVVGRKYPFYRTLGQIFRIDPNGTDVIVGGGAGKYIELNAANNFLELECIESNLWTIKSSYGALAYEP